MARIFKKDSAHTTIVAGIIKDIKEDGSMIIATREASLVPRTNDNGEVMKGADGKTLNKVVWNEKDQVVVNEFGFSANDYKIGYAATAVGELRRNGTLNADMVISGKSGVYTYPYQNKNGVDVELQVIAGFVKFAGYNAEVNPEDGQPYKNQKGENRKPHFDLCVAVRGEDGKYVSHIVKYYDTKNAQHQIEACKKAFADYDKTKNSAFVTIVTTPGEEKVKTRQVDGGKEEKYFRCEHLGNTIPDVIIVNSVRDRDKSNQTKEAAEPEQSSDGFNNPAAPLDDYDEMENFQ